MSKGAVSNSSFLLLTRPDARESRTVIALVGTVFLHVCRLKRREDVHIRREILIGVPLFIPTIRGHTRGKRRKNIVMDFNSCFLLLTVNDEFAAMHPDIFCLIIVRVDMVARSAPECVCRTMEAEESNAVTNSLEEVLHAFGADRRGSVAAFLVKITARIKDECGEFA